MFRSFLRQCIKFSSRFKVLFSGTEFAQRVIRLRQIFGFQTPRTRVDLITAKALVKQSSVEISHYSCRMHSFVLMGSISIRVKLLSRYKPTFPPKIFSFFKMSKLKRPFYDVKLLVHVLKLLNLFKDQYNSE